MGRFYKVSSFSEKLIKSKHNPWKKQPHTTGISLLLVYLGICAEQVDFTNYFLSFCPKWNKKIEGKKVEEKKRTLFPPPPNSGRVLYLGGWRIKKDCAKSHGVRGHCVLLEMVGRTVMVLLSSAIKEGFGELLLHTASEEGDLYLQDSKISLNVFYLNPSSCKAQMHLSFRTW